MAEPADPIEWLLNVGRKLLNVPGSGMPADQWQAAWQKILADAEDDLQALMAEGFRGSTQELAAQLNAFVDARLHRLPGGGAPPQEIQEPREVSAARLTLGVSQEASVKEAEKAYHEKAKTMHPDRGGDPEQFTQLIAAIRILRENEKRSQP
jgi:hypothetical protein